MTDVTRRLLPFLALPACLAAGLPAQDAPGKAVYERWCSGCHGATGAGDGDAAAFMLPRPRDFTKGVYQIRSTASGSLPTDADLHQIVNLGMPGTAMPGWKARLSERERADVVGYIKSFSRFFASSTPELLTLGSPPGESAEGLAEGRQAFEKLECFKCHGPAGRGDGQSAPSLKDDADFPIRAADLTESWQFNGGADVAGIYARLRTGLDGTPMPSFSDAIESQVITDEQLWRVAQYVRSLSPRESPTVRDVIRARLVTRLPAGPGDSAWTVVEAYYVPLVGQIVQRPRWFTPSVDGIWVRALHDGQQLALRVSWTDPSKSPDPEWQEWLDRIGQTVGRDDTTALAHGPDRLRVQFPPRLSDDLERPYFLGGTGRKPAHVWLWRSDPDILEAGPETGLGQFRAGSGQPQVKHAAAFAQGEWQVQFTRSLVPADTGSAPTFPTGMAIPIAFGAADGSNGEDLVQGAVSAWYSVYLDTPTPARVYIQPLVAAVLAAGLGILIVVRAQRGQRPGGAHVEAS